MPSENNVDPGIAKSLESGLQQYDMQLASGQVQQLADYCQLLWTWNEQINLTRHTTAALFVSRDVLDAWQLSQLIAPDEELLDVGAGGGAMGIILAIIRPDLDVSLCESMGKKARVLQDIVKRLDLPVAVQHARAEQLMEDFRYDVLTARAVGPLWKMCRWFEPHWTMFDRLLAVKGPKWVEERQEARHRGMLRMVELRKVASYPLPGTDSDSVILKLWQKGRSEPTPEVGPSPSDARG